MKEKLLLAAAALRGFATACNNEEDQPKVVSMYGVPYNNYKIKGKVTDKAGRPIKGIEVRSNAYLPTPEATTAADGTYDLSGKGVGNTARVTFTATDGPATGSAKADLQGGHNDSGRADEDGQMNGTVETRRYDRALAASLSQLILNRIGECQQRGGHRMSAARFLPAGLAFFKKWDII